MGSNSISRITVRACARLFALFPGKQDFFLFFFIFVGWFQSDLCRNCTLLNIIIWWTQKHRDFQLKPVEQFLLIWQRYMVGSIFVCMCEQFTAYVVCVCVVYPRGGFIIAVIVSLIVLLFGVTPKQQTICSALPHLTLSLSRSCPEDEVLWSCIVIHDVFILLFIILPSVTNIRNIYHRVLSKVRVTAKVVSKQGLDSKCSVASIGAFRLSPIRVSFYHFCPANCPFFPTKFKCLSKCFCSWKEKMEKKFISVSASHARQHTH